MAIYGLKNWTETGREEKENDIRITAHYEVDLDRCPHCAGRVVKFGPRSVLFMDLPHGSKRVGLQVERQRYRCKDCNKISLQPLPDIDEKRDSTKRLITYIVEQAKKRTFSSIAGDVGVVEGTIRSIFDAEVKKLDETHKPETPEILGIDEVYLMGKHRCVLVNIEESTIIDLLRNRDQDLVTDRLWRTHDRKRVKTVAIDMWEPYVTGAQAVFGKRIPVIVDKWHVTKYANLGMEEVRKAVRRELSAKRRRVLKGDRFLLLTRAHRLEPFQKLIVQSWCNEFPLLGQAYALKEGFYGIYDAPDRFEAMQRYRTWLLSVPKELEAAFKPLLRALRNWEQYIFRYFDFLPDQRITNAKTEALNGLIKNMHRNGRGYSFDVLRAKVLYTHGVRKVRPVVYQRSPWVRETMTEMIMTHKPSDVLDFGADISTLLELQQKGEL
jgi:transposase